MKTLIGGGVAAVVGLIFLVIFWSPFLNLLAGVIPIMLLLGGCLALYLGFDELKDNWKGSDTAAAVDPADEVEKYKKEIDDLKKEVETLKKG